MEPLAMAVGGARPSISCSLSSSSSSSSPLCSSTARNPSNSLFCATSRKRIIGYRAQKFHSLAAFQSSAHLFSCPTSSLHAQKKQQKARIFLPHLVASLEQVEQSYIMIKPDGVQRGLVGEIISRFEKKGFKLIGLKLFQCPKELGQEHYKDLQSKPFFPKLIEYITSGPVVCMAWEGVGVVASARKLIGATNPLQAEPGTIRGDLAVETGRNVVHGSDSPENGQREIALWFKEGELFPWTPAQEPWLRE